MGEVFLHAVCVVTLVDRLIHRAEVIEIDAESCCLKEAQRRQRRAAVHPKALEFPLHSAAAADTL